MNHTQETDAPEAHVSWATDLVADLAEHVGDPEAVAEVLRQRHDRLTADAFAAVTLSALAQTFAECLSRHDGPIPPGATRFRHTSKEHRP